MNRLDLDLVIDRADRSWSVATESERSEPERLAAIARSVRDHVHLHVLDQVEVELGSTRGLLGRLVTAVAGEWDPDQPATPQVTAALRELAAVAAYLRGLNKAQKGAA